MVEVATDWPVQRAGTRRQGSTEKGTVTALAMGETSQGGQHLKGQTGGGRQARDPTPRGR